MLQAGDMPTESRSSMPWTRPSSTPAVRAGAVTRLPALGDDRGRVAAWVHRRPQRNLAATAASPGGNASPPGCWVWIDLSGWTRPLPGPRPWMTSPQHHAPCPPHHARPASRGASVAVHTIRPLREIVCCPASRAPNQTTGDDPLLLAFPDAATETAVGAIGELCVRSGLRYDSNGIRRVPCQGRFVCQTC